MSKQLKQTLVVILIGVIFLAFLIISYFKSKTYYNDENVIGNTAGNLYNGGLFSEHNGRIYFSNFNDDGALYSMNLECSEVKKITTDKPTYINVDDHYIYYSRVNDTKQGANDGFNNFYSRGIYRINHDNSNLVMLFNGPTGLMSLYGNKILYQHYTTQTGITFYEVKINGKDEKKLSDVPLLPASYYDGYLFYAGASDDHYIHAMNMETKEDTVIYDGNCYMPIATKDGIFFIAVDENYALCYYDLKTQTRTVLVDRFCTTYNISNDLSTIYYQVDGGENNRICKLDLSTLVTETIIDGDYKNIHVTSNYVFFRDYKETNTYAYSPSTGALQIFHAPVID